jgi:para-nitrobenzyl esterase
MKPSAEAEAAGVKAVDALGVKTMAELRARPLDMLTGLNSQGLVIDGYLIPEDESLTFQAGKQNAVDVLTGSNKDEANFGICGPNAGLNGRGGTGLTAAAFKSNAEKKYGDLAPEFLKLYPAATDDEARHAAHEACADEITWNMRQWSVAQEKKGKKAYTYFFSRVQTVRLAPGRDEVGPSPAGATHTADISFAWNNPKGQATQMWNDVDTKLADQMSSYWVNFIVKGDPNGAGLAKWPEFKELSKSTVMVFGDTPQAEAAAPATKLAFYTAAFQRLLKGAPGAAN